VFEAGDTETVGVIRPPDKDRFGDPRPGTGGEDPAPGCLFAPGPSAEHLQGANQTDADGTLYMPTGSPTVRAVDRIRVRGDIYEVIGKPRVWGAAGVELVLRQTTG
jgi:hypothetical protein